MSTGWTFSSSRVYLIVSRILYSVGKSSDGSATAQRPDWQQAKEPLWSLPQAFPGPPQHSMHSFCNGNAWSVSGMRARK